jgi:hypothetical protein
VRTHLAANDAAFNCVVEQEDKEGTRGVTLSKELMAIAGGWCAWGWWCTASEQRGLVKLRARLAGV